MVPGMIMLWHGTLATVPSGWAICDGTMGTPNLSGKFIWGGGSGFTPGASGGSTTHTHPFTGDGHAHDLGVGTEVVEDDPNGQHAHHTSTNLASGTTDSGSNLPPWYVLAYIMKL